MEINGVKDTECMFMKVLVARKVHCHLSSNSFQLFLCFFEFTLHFLQSLFHLFVSLHQQHKVLSLL